jgi:hypothetical protein
MKLIAKFENHSPLAEPKPSKSSPEGGPPVSPAARTLALAHYIARMIERGLIRDYTDAARMLGVSQARMTHVMSLLLLAPELQEELLFERLAPGDKKLRRIARIAEWRDQASALR